MHRFPLSFHGAGRDSIVDISIPGRLFIIGVALLSICRHGAFKKTMAWSSLKGPGVHVQAKVKVDTGARRVKEGLSHHESIREQGLPLCQNDGIRQFPNFDLKYEPGPSSYRNFLNICSSECSHVS